MKRIDAHQHFWKFHPVKDAWLTDEMMILKQDFMPHDLQPILKKNGVDGCIAVQSDQSLIETQFLLDLAGDFSFIQGVVGWVDIQDEELDEQLDFFSHENKLKGFRHIVQGESDPEFLLRPAFLSGIKKLHERNFTYDLLITYNQLSQAVRFADQLAEGQSVVIDHLAKPNILEKEFDSWAAYMKKLSQHTNFYCKFSGLVTEAKWNSWTKEDFEPYINHIFDSFGAERIIFGSDWPVCTLAADYSQIIELVSSYVDKLSKSEQEMVWHKNAQTFYKL
ncbi:MAG TPA: amidohydrolase family protein [Sphingobacteriaceae bacterium]|nr:amidohydrolase family protein [Sphingobacteriaceae bacterium]